MGRDDGTIRVNGEPIADGGYLEYHRRRIAWTIAKLHEIGARRVIEMGSHPWVMTAALIDDPRLELCATVSAEEVSRWPDDIGLQVRPHTIRTAAAGERSFPNYSANVERTRFEISEAADTVLACEILEHLVRAPHVMLLNVNRWLPIGGKLVATTPNGAQFSNPLRRRSSSAAYRSSVYERHSYLYTLGQLLNLVGLCGFRLVEAGFVDLYPRSGAARGYGWAARLPGSYFREKFSSTLFAVGEKEKDVAELERPPAVCDRRGEWEFVRARTGATRSTGTEERFR